jgi:membrane-bound lytic murein transglycosylase B
LKIERNIVLNVAIALVIIFLATTRITFDRNAHKEIYAKYLFFKPVIDTLIARGADSAYIYTLALYPRTQFSERYVKINVTGYLNKPDYSQNLQREAVVASRLFIQNNLEILEKSEYYYHVPKEIVTAILWIETKLGGYTGNNHIPSVLFSTAMVNKPEFIWMNLENLKETQINDSLQMDSLKKKIILRSKTKSEWAINELLHLEKIRKKLPMSTLELEGSWAGAFGLAQFLPSSYYKWAVDGNGDGKVDLFEVDDAVSSICNYLKTNGWNGDLNAQRSAIFHYNNSNDYVDAVLGLAGKLR